MGLFVEPIDPPDSRAWKVSLETAQDMPQALAAAASLGYQGSVQTFIQPNSADPVTGMPIVLWTVTFKRPGAEDLVAYMDDWIVYDGTHITIHSPSDFVSRFTADVPLEWQAEPVVEALPSDRVSITFDQPTSCNGPFTYEVEAADATADSTAPLSLLGDPVVVDGKVTLTGGGLVTDHVYTFVVTVRTRYNCEATSAPSDPITAVL